MSDNRKNPMAASYAAKVLGSIGEIEGQWRRRREH